MSVAFLADYETANNAIKRFHAEFPNGRIIPEIVSEHSDLIKGIILVRTEIYKDFSDAIPVAVDYAYGNVALYPEHMKKFFVEDTFTSAIARSIKLLTPSETRASAEDIERVEKFASIPYQAPADDGWINVEVKSLGSAFEEVAPSIAAPGEPGAPNCSHGFMIRKEGVSPKTGKPFKGWVCSSKNRDFQCKPVWENL
jgi:hypothetical protein